MFQNQPKHIASGRTGQGLGRCDGGYLGTPLRCAAAATPPPHHHGPTFSVRCTTQIPGKHRGNRSRSTRRLGEGRSNEKKEKKNKKKKRKKEKKINKKILEEKTALHGSVSGPLREMKSKMVQDGARVILFCLESRLTHSLVLGLDMAGLHGVLHSSFLSAQRPCAPTRSESWATRSASHLKSQKVPANNDINMLNTNSSNTDPSTPNQIR